MSVFPVVKGVRLRATKINSCGLPIGGEANRLVTDGFVSVELAPVMRDAQDLEQVNAEGQVCVTDRTPPTRKYYTVTVELCQVNTGLISMFNGWSQVLDYANNSVGFEDDDDVDSDYGVALEVWTGGRADDDCPTQENDSVFATTGSGQSHGYLLFGANEFTMGNVKVDANISTFTLTGRTIALSQWGRGPYNVVPTDAAGTAGRLLKPLDRDAHFLLQRTTVAPPPVTPGASPVPLDITGTFVDPKFYFGGPSGAPATDVAPEQVIPLAASATAAA
jgi:hypothetical protein